GTAAAKVQELDKFSGQIGSIVEAIDDIAEQTNLLALNAAIEAARAGEHGRGFAVVADEVRKLAERSSRETKQIGDLIAQVQRGTHEAVSAMEQGSREVETGAQLAEEAGEALKNILTAVQVANQQTMQIASAASQMESASQEVVGLMDSVSAIVEESTAATEEMAASTEEMSAQVEEIVAQAQSLAAMAEELQAAVAQFKVGEEDGVTMRRRQSDWGNQKGSGTPQSKPRPLSAV
ncbi:MAG: methyl-accepting chemotaxis protein, partial [Chloroflexota bacterium]